MGPLALSRSFVCVVLMAFFAASSASGEVVYKLGSGDKLKVTVYEEKDLSGSFEVGGEGVVSLPLIGAVSASGVTIRELEKRIESKLLEGYLRNPKVNIEVTNYRPFYILGEVKEPGSYPYVNGMSVLNAVALGGGFTYRANKRNITLLRAGSSEGQKQVVGPDTKVLPGDLVRVEERFF
jgi:protein involved in polysaccharide export with SLBB domain